MNQKIKNSVYSIVDLFTFGKGIKRKINGFKIAFPSKWSRYFETDYESENVAFLKKQCQSGMTALDIGAHLGLMSVTMAQLTGKSGKVFAFEPTPSTFLTLKKVVQMNGFEETIECINEAVSDADGEIDFYVSSTEGSNANSLVNRSDSRREMVKIKTVRLDTFTEIKKITTLDILKIDAEGVELAVLNGAKTTLNSLRPKVILAIHPSLVKSNGNSLTEIFDLISDLNYRVEYKNDVLDKTAFCSKEDFFDVHLYPKP